HIMPLHVATLEDWLRDIHPDPTKGEVYALVHDLVSTRLRQVVPDVPVYVLDDRTHNALSGQPNAVAVHYVPRTPQHSPFITIKASVINDPAAVSHLIKHEGIHAATTRILNTDIESRLQVARLMDAVRTAILAKDITILEPPQGTFYGLTNEKEFLSESH